MRSCKTARGESPCRPFCMLWLFQFEQRLRDADDHQNLHQQSIAQATVVYYCSRMEAVSLVPLRNVSQSLCSGAESYAQAWKEGNESVAQYMLRNITGMLFRCSASSGPRAHLIILESNVERLAHLSARDVCAFQFHLMSVTLKVSPFFFSSA